MNGALKHPNQHPLIVLFYTKRLSWQRGMNVLNEGPELFVSDNCVRPEEVASCDVDAVLARAGAWWAKSQLYPWSADACTPATFSESPGAARRAGSAQSAPSPNPHHP